MATFVVAQDATPEELADFMRLLGEVQPAGAMCPACGVRVAGVSGLCAECANKAGRLSYAAQEDATQEDSRIATLSVSALRCEAKLEGQRKFPAWGAMQCHDCGHDQWVATFDGEKLVSRTCVQCGGKNAVTVWRYGPALRPTSTAAQEDSARGVPTVSVEQLDADTAHVEVLTAEGNTVFTATLPTDSTGTVRLYLAKGYTVEVLRGEDYWYDLEKDGIPF